METTVKKTWKPITAGILNVITGALGAISAIGLIIAITATSTWQLFLDVIPPAELPFIAPLISSILIILLVLSIFETALPLAGGVFALQRRRWGWALTGSIIAIIAVLPLGIASTIFVSLAKDEFA